MLDRSLVAVTDMLATVPGAIFCVKSVDGRYLAINHAFVEAHGVAGSDEVIGRTPHDLFPREVADRYAAQDRQVLATGHMLTNELELITRGDRTTGWFLTSKSRWLDADGQPAGLVTISIDLRTPDASAAPHPHLVAAIGFARRRFAEQVSVAAMAEAAQMSSQQLERLCRRVLGFTPKQLLMRFRIEEALRLLETTDRTVADIGVACGYYDQSAFTRHFRRVVGHTPTGWRNVVSR